MKKILLFILTFSMIVSFALPFTSVAAEEDAADVIEIDTAEELATIGNDENYPLDGNYKLTADIVTATGISGTFTGTFNGDGHKVSGLTTPLFDVIVNATVENVIVFATIAGESTEDITRVAIVAAKAEQACTFENVTAEGSITYNCNNKATYLGAIVGESWSNSAGATENNEVNIIGCTNKADITLTNPNKFSTGGILGYASGYGIVNVTRCVNEGDITATSGDSSIAGIVGRFNETKSANDLPFGYFTECANLGDIIVTDATAGAAAGIVCSFASGVFSKCYNVGNIEHNKESVGIVQWWSGQKKAPGTFGLIEYCYNASPKALTYELYDTIKEIATWNNGMLKGNCYITGRKLLNAGGADKVDANDPNVAHVSAADMINSLGDNGYVMDPNVAYPILPFQLKNLTLEHTEDDGSSFFYQQNTTDASLIRVIGLLDAEVAKSASAIEVTFSNGSDTKVFTIDNATAYSSIDATFDGVEVTYVACDGAVILGWVFKGVPENYVPTTVDVVK